MLCPICETEKPVSEMSNTSFSPRRCKICVNKYYIKRRYERKIMALDRQSPSYQEDREELQEQLRLKLANYQPSVSWPADFKYSRVYSQTRARSEKKGHSCSFLSPEEFVSLMHDSSCFYCGGPPTGLDRVENSLGYTFENSVPCCTKCNMAKGTMSQDEFLYHIRLIVSRF